MQHLELLARLVALHRIHVQVANLRIYFAVKTCYFWENHSLESYKVYYVKKLTNTYFLCKNDSPLAIDRAWDYTPTHGNSHQQDWLWTFVSYRLLSRFPEMSILSCKALCQFPALALDLISMDSFESAVSALITKP